MNSEFKDDYQTPTTIVNNPRSNWPAAALAIGSGCCSRVFVLSVFAGERFAPGTQRQPGKTNG